MRRPPPGRIDALQAAAHHLGHIGGVEQHERDHGAQQPVADTPSAGAAARSTADMNSTVSSGTLATVRCSRSRASNDRQLRASAEREQNAEGQRSGDGDKGDDHVEHQPAPEGRVDISPGRTRRPTAAAMPARGTRSAAAEPQPAMPGIARAGPACRTPPAGRPPDRRASPRWPDSGRRRTAAGARG